jgi:Ser/Thr protein kinase RdoA (MazF antagonist)
MNHDRQPQPGDCLANFAALSPERVVQAAETALGRRFTAHTATLPSYINRVYELKARDGERLIAKFYRPGRWTRAAIAQEHAFIRDCAAEDVPVVAPLPLSDGTTLADADGIPLALFPKRSGRQFEITADEDWRRIGGIIARIHLAGASADASERIRLHPAESTAADVEELLADNVIPADHLLAFRDVCTDILDMIEDRFDDIEEIRVHGDLHLGNLLHRPGEGLMVIDFDDMVIGPPVQDLWLLLPDHAPQAQREIRLLLDGYAQFRDFDDATLPLIEPLRAMRLIYFLAWCARQRHDRGFHRHFPDWGDSAFWTAEIRDLECQADRIHDILAPASPQEYSSPRQLTDD